LRGCQSYWGRNLIGAKAVDMAKERKTVYELEVLIFNEARKARECEGMTSVTVREIADARVDYNWQVRRQHVRR